MPRLKNRQEAPPYGWQFIQPQISPGAPLTGHTLDDLARKILDLRRGNAGITAQYNLSTDLNVIGNEVEEQNAQRCLAHNWGHLVQDMANAPPMPSFSKPQRLPRVAAAGAATGLKRAVVGVATIRDWWLGDSLKPVAAELAEKRALICSECPVNGDPNLLERLSGEVASTIRGLIQAREDMDLKTSVDDKLQTCKACGCFLKLKVHTPLQFALKNLKPEERVKLDQRCWILHES